MKRRSFGAGASGVLKGIVLAGLTAWVAGCGAEKTDQAAAPTSGPGPASAVRGDAIRGEPIVAPGSAPAAVAAANGSAPANTPTPASPPSVEPASPAASAVASATPAAPAASAASEAAPNPTAGPAGATGGDEKSTLVAAAAKPDAPVKAGTATEPMVVGFDRLASFKYDLPDGPVETNAVVQAQSASQIPETIRALNNQFVALKGFMLPLKVEKGLVTEMLILRDQSMCCYGSVPRINEWVSVKMQGAGVKPVMDQAVTLFGRLKVGEMYENGYLVGIYAIDGDRMAGPLDM